MSKGKMRDYIAVSKKEKIDAIESKLQSFESEENAIEQTFIKSKGLNISSIADIDSSDDFERLSAEYFALPKIIAIESEITAACKVQKQIENELIERALAITPAKLALRLREGLHLISCREEIIKNYLAYAG